MTDELETMRIQAFRNASESMKELYSNLSLGTVLTDIIVEYKFDNVRSVSLIDSIGDAILGLYPKNKFREETMRRCTLQESDAQKIESRLAQFLSLIEGPMTLPEAPKDLRERLELRPDAAPVGGPRPAVDMGTGNRPLSREEVLSALSPRRTMTGDIQTIQQRTVPPPPPPPPAQ